MEEVGEGGLLEAATASPPSLPVGEVSLEQSEALAGAVGLEALAARASVLPALPAHADLDGSAPPHQHVGTAE